MSQLRPCSACGRHVRFAETSCPFCDAALETVARSAKHAPRLGRAALLAFGAATATAATLAACSSGTGPYPIGDGGSSESSSGGGSETGPQDTGLPDRGNIAMPYGAPPADGLLEMV